MSVFCFMFDREICFKLSSLRHRSIRIMPPIPKIGRDDPNRNPEQDEIENIETPQFIIAAGSSDDESDDGEENYAGYQILPQEPGQYESEDDLTLEEDAAAACDSSSTIGIENEDFSQDLSKSNAGSSYQVPDIKNAEAEERRTIWQDVKTDHEPLNTEQVDNIKKAMANISLPKLVVPDWARVVPEEDWKSKLFARLQKSNQTEQNDTKTDEKTDEDSVEQKDDCDSV